MKHPAFSIDKNPNLDRNLSSTLIHWKLFADQFYRSSECIFNQVAIDYRKMIIEVQERKPTAKMDIVYKPDIESVYVLMIGYCLENMIKGLLIFNDPTLTSGKSLNKKIKTHNLSRLSKGLKVPFTEEESQLMDVITVYIEWLAKYPIPTKASETLSSWGLSIESVRCIFVDIYRKLSLEMQATGLLSEHMHNYLFDTRPAEDKIANIHGKFFARGKTQ